jgi:hypothetical protein
MVKRNKSLGLPTHKDDKIISIDVDQSIGSAAPYTHTVGIASTRRTALDSRRPAKSNESSTLHAVLFVVLVAIVISWALGY